MVARVYVRDHVIRDSQKWLERGYHNPVEILSLRDGSSGECDVSEYYSGRRSYDDLIVIGREDGENIELQGVVIHKIIKSVMRGSNKELKLEMIGHLERLIEIVDKENG